MRKYAWFVSALFLGSMFVLTGCGEVGPNPGPDPNTNSYKGQTSFTNEDTGEGSNSFGSRGAAEDSSNAAPNAGASADGKQAAPGAPSGRTGTVEEADLYRVHKNLLFYLNTYKGLTVFDLSDRKKPKKLSNLPVFGYPIEMFVENNVAYALVRDALYLLRVNGKFEFKRRHVSQLITIDITNPNKPQVLQRLDIKGQLREGVSRKIDDTIYVVSYTPKYYYWGWSYSSKATEEQATVYSFNIANPRGIKLVQSIDLIKDRPTNQNTNPENGGESYSFSGVTIAATSNTLLVGENWSHYKYERNSGACGSRSESFRYTKLHVVDISDPKGSIRIHTSFKIRGNLSDQFKQTYLFDEASQKGTYLGIFQRNEWSYENCRSTRVVKNTLVSIDITDGQNPKVLDELSFGKPNETVRGSLFDPQRKVVYAITAVQRDPFYAISFADLKNLKVLSEIDGLSGDINLFRFLKDRKFLLAVGRDNSSACTGFDSDNQGWRSTQLAVSIIDVRDLSKARLVQRKCVAIKNAGWSWSEINWNLDQAHKMIGMHSDGDKTLLTVPVSYYSRSTSNGWWWSEYKSAIGIMQWDLSKYDDTKNEKEQDVMQNVATIVHPKGSVKRTIILNLNQKRTVLNLSETHLSLVDLEDLRQPALLSTFEIAPYIGTVYRFGKYLVEQVSLGRSYNDYNEFRVKEAGANVNDAPILTTLKVGRVERVVRWNNKLLLFTRPLDATRTSERGYPVYDYQKSVVRVYDFSDPRNPKPRGSLTLPFSFFPYYYFYCGTFDMAFDFGYSYYYSQARWVSTSQGLVILTNQYDYSSKTRTTRLGFVNLSNADKPAYSEKIINTNNSYYYSMNLVSLDDKNFYLVDRKHYKSVTRDGRTYNLYRFYAQPWTLSASGWNGGKQINIPGHVLRVFRKGNKVQFLTYDSQSVRRSITNDDGAVSYRYQTISRLFLLEQVGSDKASLLDFKSFTSWRLRSILYNNGRLYMASNRDWYWLQDRKISWQDNSDQLMIFDLSKNTFRQMFSQPTRTMNVQLVGVQNNRLIIKLPNEGILLADVTNPASPKGLHFERTLGWVTNMELSGNTAYVAAGHFGIYQLDISKQTIPSEPM